MLRTVEYLTVASAIAFAICLIALMFFYGSPSSAPQPPQQQHTEENKAIKNQSEAEKPFWEKVTTDPVAAFTLFLVIFTAVLSAVGVIQLKMLLRAETVAEKTAQAAQDSAEAAIKAANANVSALEISRAQIRAYFNCSLSAKLGPDNKQIIKYSCKNTGQSQARTVSVTIVFGFQEFERDTFGYLPNPVTNFTDDLSQGDPVVGEMPSSNSVPIPILKQPRWAHRIKCIVTFEDIFKEHQRQEFEAYGLHDPNAQDFIKLVRPPGF